MHCIVFDGHCGAEVARYVGRHISSVLKKDRDSNPGKDPKMEQCQKNLSQTR